MKKLITVALLSVATFANAKNTDTTYNIIYVQAQGLPPLKLSKSDVRYILSQTRNESIAGALSGRNQTIRFNDVADNIIKIWRAKK
jgi:hypothetical protein